MTPLMPSVVAPVASDDLIYHVHAAGDSDEAWSGVLARIRAQFQVRWAALAQHSFATREARALYAAPPDPRLCEALADHSANNPWFLSSDAYREGRVLSGDELLSNRELVKTDFYRGMLLPHGLFHRLCGVIARRNALVYTLDLHRGPEEPRFGTRERHAFAALLPHLTLALDIRWRRRETEDMNRALTSMVNAQARAAMLVDEHAQLVFGSDGAKRACEGAAGLRIEHGRLVAAVSADDRALQDAIVSATRARTFDDAQTAHVLSLSAPGCAAPAVVAVRNAGPVFRAELGETRHLAIVTALNACAEDDHTDCAFVRQFGLSPAQARMNALIVTGHSIANAALALHISENTARSHLKQIFRKTDTHSQMELVHLHGRVCLAS
ncbi:helix-turn-helix transcriptional regulator [Caballeronia sp. LZ065]|uniref:helix-turn-helix transcriptional regulator n=1 Tax=Caballeronia sp. LZ065 TaxID=3038571 RepID=UPI00285FC93E|nr:helix-turn-helix transcriptional regulator [Caballeronia sp. LZ065]MDR5781009.1 helix-turn-helix transcriptional regulator [Caballeronia sp. LZ065]